MLIITKYDEVTNKQNFPGWFIVSVMLNLLAYMYVLGPDFTLYKKSEHAAVPNFDAITKLLN